MNVINQRKYAVQAPLLPMSALDQHLCSYSKRKESTIGDTIGEDVTRETSQGSFIAKLCSSLCDGVMGLKQMKLSKNS